MKPLLLLLTAAALLSLPAAGQLAVPAPAAGKAAPAAPLSADEQALARRLDEMGAAIEAHDMKALDKLMAPEYVHHNPNNQISTRAAELAFMDTWGPTRVRRLTPVRVNRYGTTAVTVASCAFSSTFEGKTNDMTLQMMMVWVLRGGVWQIAVSQSKVLPA